MRNGTDDWNRKSEYLACLALGREHREKDKEGFSKHVKKIFLNFSEEVKYLDFVYWSNETYSS